MKRVELKLTMALIEGLLQGKEVHFTEPDIEVVIYPPNGNVVMTRDQYHELLREAEYKGMRSFISMLESVNQMKVIKKEAEQVSSEKGENENSIASN